MHSILLSLCIASSHCPGPQQQCHGCQEVSPAVLLHHTSLPWLLLAERFLSLYLLPIQRAEQPCSKREEKTRQREWRAVACLYIYNFVKILPEDCLCERGLRVDRSHASGKKSQRASLCIILFFVTEWKATQSRGWIAITNMASKNGFALTAPTPTKYSGITTIITELL